MSCLSGTPAYHKWRVVQSPLLSGFRRHFLYTSIRFCAVFWGDQVAMKIDKYDAQKYPEVRGCKWHIVRAAVEPDTKPCELRFVVCDHGRLDGFCKRHLALEMEENVRLRAALLCQLADMVMK